MMVASARSARRAAAGTRSRRPPRLSPAWHDVSRSAAACGGRGADCRAASRRERRLLGMVLRTPCAAASRPGSGSQVSRSDAPRPVDRSSPRRRDARGRSRAPRRCRPAEQERSQIREDLLVPAAEDADHERRSRLLRAAAGSPPGGSPARVRDRPGDCGRPRAGTRPARAGHGPKGCASTGNGLGSPSRRLSSTPRRMVAGE